MRLFLQAPSFWGENRDPGAWQRALQRLAKEASIPPPWPCWKKVLKGSLTRRAVPGLYGLKMRPTPTTLVGVGFLEPRPNNVHSWQLSEAGQILLEASASDFPTLLATQVIKRSPWLRLALNGLTLGTWRLPKGIKPIRSLRGLQLGEDLVLTQKDWHKALPSSVLLGDQHPGSPFRLEIKATTCELSALQAPLYLLSSLGWINDSGRPTLPAKLAAHLGLESEAELLRRVCSETADERGFVAFEFAARGLSQALGQNGAKAPWMDKVFDRAIRKGWIEVESWEPGQPRHGRGFGGDRQRKRVRWVIHDDFVTGGIEE